MNNSILFRHRAATALLIPLALGSLGCSFGAKQKMVAEEHAYYLQDDVSYSPVGPDEHQLQRVREALKKAREEERRDANPVEALEN